MKRNLVVMILALFALASLLSAPPVLSQDLKTNLDLQMIVAPTTGAADITSSAISTDNYKTSLLGIYSTANASWSASAKLDIVMTHCASSTGTFLPVSDSDVYGADPDANGVIYTFDKATAAATLEKIQYIGRMPYFKIKADFTNVLNVATPTVSVFAVHGGKIIAQ